MIKKNIIISFVLLILIWIGNDTYAQQIPLFDQYYINPMLYNPANTGYDNSFNAYLIRNQKFQNFNNGQIINSLTIDASLRDNKSGIGLSLTSDDLGIFNTTKASFSYSYKVKITTKNIFRLGLAVGISDYRLNLDKINVDISDNYIINSSFKKAQIIANIGLFYQYNEKVTFGISVPQLLANSITEKQGDSEIEYKLARHYLASASYKYDLKLLADFSITPYAMIRYIENTPIQYDFNLIFSLEDKAWFALSYKQGFSVGMNLGIHLKENFKIGYSYGYILNNTPSFAQNNHEFLLAYSFSTKKSKSRYSNDNTSVVLDEKDDIKTLKSLLEDKYSKIQKLRHELNDIEVNEKREDWDRDGVPNSIDECPETPLFYIVDHRGCSVDSDNDGVVDSEDYCPNIPGSVVNNGCPSQNKEKIEIDSRLENIYFAFGKFYITDYSRDKLQLIIKLMKSNKHYILKMHGHTDNIGSLKTNEQISNRRLQIVKKYLIDKGVAKNRIIIIPHGEIRPVTNNNSEKNRAINRRIAFEIYEYK